MKKKIAISAFTLSLLVGGTGIYAYNHAMEAAQLKQLKLETLQDARKAVDSLYNSKRTRLSENIEKKIETANKAVNKLQEDSEKHELIREISRVEKIAKVQYEVYSTIENGSITENLTAEHLDTITQKLIVIKSISGPIYAHLSDYLSKAHAQLKTLDEAMMKIKEAEKSISLQTYNKALIAVEEVNNTVKKDELKNRLNRVKQTLVAMEEERLAAEKVAEEKRGVAEIKNEPSSSATTSYSSTSVANSPSSDAVSESNRKVSESSSSSKPSNSASSPAASSGSGSGSSNNSTISEGTNWDKVGEKLENHDWSNTGTGEIDEGGNTWESWN
jgi:peptidoglycan DL-endopeptidase CwlO